MSYLMVMLSEVTSSRNLVTSSNRPSLIKAVAIVASVFAYCFLLLSASDLNGQIHSAMNFYSRLPDTSRFSVIYEVTGLYLYMKGLYWCGAGHHGLRHRVVV